MERREFSSWPVIALLAFAAVGVVFAILSLQQRPERPDAVAGLGALADPDQTYDPVRAGEPTPPGYRQLLARDRIAPVYNPTFVSAATSDWPDHTQVIGLAIDGEARAYPVGFLNGREMVIDRLAGIPVLVTW